MSYRCAHVDGKNTCVGGDGATTACDGTRVLPLETTREESWPMRVKIERKGPCWVPPPSQSVLTVYERFSGAVPVIALTCE